MALHEQKSLTLYLQSKFQEKCPKSFKKVWQDVPLWKMI